MKTKQQSSTDNPDLNEFSDHLSFGLSSSDEDSVNLSNSFLQNHSKNKSQSPGKPNPRIQTNSRNLKKRSKILFKIDRKMGMKLAQLQRNHTISWGSEALYKKPGFL